VDALRQKEVFEQIVVIHVAADVQRILKLAINNLLAIPLVLLLCAF
jgi:hypothetical protein